MTRLRLLLVALLLSTSSTVMAQVAVPALAARVTDLTATLSPAQRASLDQTLATFEARKGSQIVVLIVPTTAPETIEQFALRVAEQWRIGRSTVDDGAILVIAKDDRTLRILTETGYFVTFTYSRETVLKGIGVPKVIIRPAESPAYSKLHFTMNLNSRTQRITELLSAV